MKTRSVAGLAAAVAVRARRSVARPRSMPRRAILVALASSPLWLGSACRTPAPVRPAAAQTPRPALERPSKADEPNTTDGIYTEEQAERGHAAFREICSECHVVADWTAPAFLDRWEEASVFRLWYWIYERMPHGKPGTLTRQQVTDALTYILQLNGLPPGDGELGSDDDTLDDYWILWKVQ